MSEEIYQQCRKWVVEHLSGNNASLHELISEKYNLVVSGIYYGDNNVVTINHLGGSTVETWESFAQTMGIGTHVRINGSFISPECDYKKCYGCEQEYCKCECHVRGEAILKEVAEQDFNHMEQIALADPKLKKQVRDAKRIAKELARERIYWYEHSNSNPTTNSDAARRTDIIGDETLIFSMLLHRIFRDYELGSP